MATHPFAVPAYALRKQASWYVVAAAVGIAFSHFANPKSSTFSLLGSVVLVGSILAAGYYATKRHVWVSLSPEGVHGKGEAARDLAIPWHEEVVVEDSARFGFKGLSIRKSADENLLGRRVATIFIPRPILELESFQSVLAQLAPSMHPLARMAKDAL